MNNSTRAFTLMEVLMAVFACAMILTSIYGILSRAVHSRDDATERTRESRLRARAASVLRNDLQNSLVSGGILAATLEGSAAASQSRFPGHLRFTTTTGRFSPNEPLGDLQEVEYYVASDSESENPDAGVLIRATHRDLLATVRAASNEERLLQNVEAMEVEFYSEGQWSDSWEVPDTESTLPDAVRVRIQQAAAENAAAPAPIEIVALRRTARSITSTTSTEAAQ